jgi:hypothetical protein
MKPTSIPHKGKKTQGIDFIICGIEHSGTTLVSDLFRQIHGCDSGFECGVLLGENPQIFKDKNPFYTNMITGWQLNENKLSEACNQESFQKFYDYIYNHSEAISKANHIRFDKTPRYINHITNVMERCDAPIIATVKSISGIAWSDYKRSKFKKESNINAFIDDWGASKIKYLRSLSEGYKVASTNARCKIIHLEDLAYSALKTCSDMFKHCNQEFHPSYFLFSNQRYAHNRSNSVNISIASEHLSLEAKELTSRIRTEFKSIIEQWPKPKHCFNLIQ